MGWKWEFIMKNDCNEWIQPLCYRRNIYDALILHRNSGYHLPHETFYLSSVHKHAVIWTRFTCPSCFAFTSVAVVELDTVLSPFWITWVRETLINITFTLVTNEAWRTDALKATHLLGQNITRTLINSTLNTTGIVVQFHTKAERGRKREETIGDNTKNNVKQSIFQQIHLCKGQMSTKITDIYIQKKTNLAVIHLV